MSSYLVRRTAERSSIDDRLDLAGCCSTMAPGGGTWDTGGTVEGGTGNVDVGGLGNDVDGTVEGGTGNVDVGGLGNDVGGTVECGELGKGVDGVSYGGAEAV